MSGTAVTDSRTPRWWVVGRGGLVGSAVVRRLAARGIAAFDPGPIPWHEPAAARDALRAAVRTFAAARHDAPHAGGAPWTVVWAAGAATTATTAEQTDAEQAALRALLDALRTDRPSGPGAFFLASSAGALYAGARDIGGPQAGPRPPFRDVDPVRPISAYGSLKLAQEEAARTALDGVCALVVGRIGNAYGPGQDLSKPQGLVSQLIRAATERQPLNIFVSLDTLRDYCYVDDIADQAVALVEAAHGAQRASGAVPPARTAIIASGEAVTVAALIKTAEHAVKRRIPLALGSHPSASAQVLDLRLVPTLDAPSLHRTSLPVGIRLVYEDVLRTLRTRRHT